MVRLMVMLYEELEIELDFQNCIKMDNSWYKKHHSIDHSDRYTFPHNLHYPTDLAHLYAICHNQIVNYLTISNLFRMNISRFVGHSNQSSRKSNRE